MPIEYQFYMGNPVPITFLAEATVHHDHQFTHNGIHYADYVLDNDSYMQQAHIQPVNGSAAIYADQQNSNQDFRMSSSSDTSQSPIFNHISYTAANWDHRYEQPAVYPGLHTSVCFSKN